MGLAVASLSKTYPGGVRALEGVSLSLGPGLFGLLGPNGAGKTTLMRVVATLLEPDSGTVELDGIDALRRRTEIRRLLGYLPQEFGLDPRLRCEELLDHLAVLKGLDDRRSRRAEVGQALERTHLADARGRRLGTFSGGMKQRFGIAQALLGRPRLLVVDEPTAGLDPEERRHLLDVLAELGSDVVVILSTHIVEDVAEMCSTLAILHRGRIRLSGEPRTLMHALAGRLWEAAGEEPASLPPKATVLGRRRQAGLSRVRVLSDESPGEGFCPASPDLEDVYLAALRSSAA